MCLGIVLGGLGLTRENALVFVAVILVWIGARQEAIGMHGRRGWLTRARVTDAAALVLGVAVVLAPVAARNYAIGGGFYVTTSQFGPNFYIGNNPRSDGTYMSLRPGRGAPEYERQDATELAEHAIGRRLTPSEVSSYWSNRALDFIGSQPGAWLRLTGRKVALLWNADEMLDTESQESHAEWSTLLSVGGWFGHFGLLVPLALLGVIATWHERARLWLLYAMIDRLCSQRNCVLRFCSLSVSPRAALDVVCLRRPLCPAHPLPEPGTWNSELGNQRVRATMGIGGDAGSCRNLRELADPLDLDDARGDREQSCHRAPGRRPAR